MSISPGGSPPVNKALLDTDTLSEIGKGKNPAITANARTYRRAFGYYSLSTVSVCLLTIKKANHCASRPQSLTTSTSPQVGPNLTLMFLRTASTLSPVATTSNRYDFPNLRNESYLSSFT